MEQLTSTPQRVPETNAEYEKLIGDNCSVYSDVSRATSRASRRSRRPHSSKDKSVSIKAPQRSRQSDSRRKEDDDNAGLDAAADDSRRWPGETDTFATSECTRISNEDLGKFHADLGARLNVSRYLNPALLSVVLTQLFAYVTPIFFLVIPKVLSESTPSLHDDCDIGCEGQIIAIAVRLFVLSLASLYLFWRTPRSKVPQINLYRTGVNFFTFLVTAVYWIFYSYKVIHWEDYEYPPIVKYSSNFVDILLFVHYLAIVLLFLRRDQEIYLLEVVRTTDGAQRFYNIGNVSIQEAASWVLEKYYVDFHLYNPALQKSSKSSKLKNVTNFQVLNVDGGGEESKNDRTRAILTAAARRRDAGHNEKYYEEVERERRVRKRKARLTEAAEDAFSHVRRQLIPDASLAGNDSMDPRQTAEIVFPSIARSMQKYLRTTRQNQHYTIEDIIDHLAFCIRYDMGANAFLNRYTEKRPPTAYPGQIMQSVDWSVTCDYPMISSLRPGVVFSIKQADYSLVVTCRTAPKLALREEFVDPASHRFVLRMDSSETSV